MGGAVAVVLIGVVIAASRPEEEGGQHEKTTAEEQNRAQVESGEGGVHLITSIFLSLAGMSQVSCPAWWDRDLRRSRCPCEARPTTGAANL